MASIIGARASRPQGCACARPPHQWLGWRAAGRGLDARDTLILAFPHKGLTGVGLRFRGAKRPSIRPAAEATVRAAAGRRATSCPSSEDGSAPPSQGEARPRYGCVQAPLSAETAARSDSFSAPERPRPACPRRASAASPPAPAGGAPRSRVGPTGFQPAPAHALERLESRFYPEAELAPRDAPASDWSRSVKRDTRLRLTRAPDDDYRPPKPFRHGSERRSAPDEGAVRSRNLPAGGHPLSIFDAESRVYGLSHVRTPAKRAYLLPQIWASQASIRHHDHPHMRRNGDRQAVKRIGARGLSACRACCRAWRPTRPGWRISDRRRSRL